MSGFRSNSTRCNYRKMCPLCPPIVPAVPCPRSSAAPVVPKDVPLVWCPSPRCARSPTAHAAPPNVPGVPHRCRQMCPLCPTAASGSRVGTGGFPGGSWWPRRPMGGRRDPGGSRENLVFLAPGSPGTMWNRFCGPVSPPYPELARPKSDRFSAVWGSGSFRELIN